MAASGKIGLLVPRGCREVVVDGVQSFGVPDDPDAWSNALQCGCIVLILVVRPVRPWRRTCKTTTTYVADGCADGYAEADLATNATITTTAHVDGGSEWNDSSIDSVELACMVERAMLEIRHGMCVCA